MSDAYLNAPQTRLLATHCCICGKALCDAISVELGCGPECRSGATGGIQQWQQDLANKLTHEAAIAAQIGNIERVNEIADEIQRLGLPVLAGKLRGRFDMVTKRKVTFKIEIDYIAAEGFFFVRTPYKRSCEREFKAAWRAIPNQFWRGEKGHAVPVAQKAKVWALLKEFFPGAYGKTILADGTEKVFKVPARSKAIAM